MWNRRLLAAAASVGAVAFAAACSDTAPMEPTAQLPDAPSLFGGTVANPGAHAENTRDAQMARIAGEVAGFAGLYRGEDGALNIMMAPSPQRASASQARQAVGARLAAMGIDLTAQPVNIVPAQYDFATLHALHQTIGPVMSIGGVVFTSADDRANRVRIGVENQAAAANVEHALSMLGVDRNAIVISESQPFELMQTLRDRVRPLGGGLQINFPGFLCTLGFNVRSPEAPNVRGFVTNSHCTNNQFGTGTMGTPYWQPSGSTPNPSDPNFIGNEVWNLPLFTGGACPAGRQCRWSDAAGVQYTSGAPDAFGAIWRTTGAGSITIDPSNPNFFITAERPFPNVGDQMNKIGRTTGWTFGNVAQSCTNLNVNYPQIPNLTLLCQETVQGAGVIVGGGDSGSPVFDNISGNNARLVGILWGGTQDGTLWAFSAMNEVRFENVAPGGLSWRTFPAP
jgi:hypothetical protein